MCSLDDLSPYFDITLMNVCKGASKETWEHQKGRKTHPPETIIRNNCLAALLNVLHKDLRIPHVSKAQLRLLSIMIRLLIEHLLEPSTSESAAANKETNKSWGHLLKFSLPVTVAYTDGSASKDKTRAGFSVIFPELPDRKTNRVKSRIPGNQTIARAEAFGVLAAILMAERDKALTIYCDREPLAKCLNLYKSKSPLPHELKKITDRSLTLRILQEIHDRPGKTTITYVKAHGKIQPGSSLTEQDRNQLRHQVHNQAADKAAKESLSEPSPLIPDESKHLPAVSVLCANSWHNEGPKYIYENNPLKLYQERYIESKQNYHLKSTAKWPQYMLTDGIWQESSFFVLHSRSNLSLKKFIVQVLGRTLPTF
jgi:ribonuclease HI